MGVITPFITASGAHLVGFERHFFPTFGTLAFRRRWSGWPFHLEALGLTNDSPSQSAGGKKQAPVWEKRGVESLGPKV